MTVTGTPTLCLLGAFLTQRLSADIGVFYVGTEVAFQSPPTGPVHHAVPAPLVGGRTGIPVAVGRGQQEPPISLPLELALACLVIETNPEDLLLLGVHVLHEERVLLLVGDGHQMCVADVAVLAGLRVGQWGVLVEVAVGGALQPSGWAGR